MFIFIDESGSFVIPKTGTRNLCCVGALIVPERTYTSLAKTFTELKYKWTGLPDEVKGSTLNEGQVTAVINSLIEHQCLFFICATEMSFNSQVVIEEYQDKQAEYMTENISDAHHNELREEAFRLRAIFEEMPSQLFIQTVLLTDLVKKVIDQATLHFAMRDPIEAGKFNWVIDGKDNKKTVSEAAWELLAAGLVQGRALDSPSIAFAKGDYSVFQKNFMLSKWPDHLPKPKSLKPGERGMIWNLKKVLYESMKFANSADSEGLQLADMITNAFRRALMGRLQRPSYDRMGELMRGLTEGPVVFHDFGLPGDQERAAFTDYNAAISVIEAKTRLAGS